jgi:hypothetical protein
MGMCLLDRDGIGGWGVGRIGWGEEVGEGDVVV